MSCIHTSFFCLTLLIRVSFGRKNYLSTMLSRLKALGPGLLYAGAAVGVSHIVQSTKAGAEYGYVLILAIILVHLFKYPFFELGPKYTQLTGHNLLHGYARLGKWSLAIVAILTVATMFTIQAAVTIVTAGLALKITGLSMSAVAMSAVLLLICFVISAIGRFSVLDKLMKVIMITLSVTTIVALISSFFADRVVVDPDATAKIFSLRNPADMIFLVALLGWMPAPLDISIWHSIWSEEKIKSNTDVDRKSMFDFKVGFWGTAVLGIFFLILGANVIYGTGATLSPKAGQYAGDLIDIYTRSIGDWSYWIIAVAAFTTMFSTTLTCLDAMPRVLTQIGKEWKEHGVESPQNAPDNREEKRRHTLRIIWTLVIAAGAVALLQFFISDMKQMVNVATSFSFLTAPILALLGIFIVKKQLPTGFWPKWKYGIAFSGVMFLLVLSVYYLVL